MLLTRPESAVPASALPMLERMGYWAQAKMNGTYSQVTVRDGDVVDTRSRHDEPHKAWEITPASRKVWKHVPKGTWVFTAELMHSKVSGIRDTHYIHDVTMADGKSLAGTTYPERWERLAEVFGRDVESETLSHWVIDPCAWLARSYRPGADYAKLFSEMTLPQHEGLVLKSATAPLQRNSTWCLKCRRPNKNLSY